jgi:hypothetical protein
MGMIGRLAAAWRDVWFAVVATLAWLSALLASCPQVDVHSVSVPGVEIAAKIPSRGPIKFLLEDEEDDFSPCGLPGVRLASPPSLTPSQITPPESVFLSLLTPAQRPLRC